MFSTDAPVKLPPDLIRGPAHDELKINVLGIDTMQSERSAASVHGDRLLAGWRRKGTVQIGEVVRRQA